MTVDQALRVGAEVLPQREGIPDSWREAAWLLAAAWGVDEVTLRVHPEREVPADVADRYRSWLERRAAGEPAHHLTGVCRFWGRDFEVSPAVLVPRPETEIVIEVALALPLTPTARVLDVGTGSGCIAVTLAAERPQWRVSAVDRSPAALAVARRNAKRSGVELKTWVGDLTSAVEPPWDLVVANLPYIPTADLGSLSLEVLRDPPSALDGGADGLDLIRRLIADLGRLLRPCGGAILEVGDDQADAVSRLAGAEGLAVARRLRDPGGAERVIVLQPR
ncbi:MAG: peptide chain release factor N(5)-glutamine methyltransferase [Thermoanaerobaculales bacterium]|nr:peptide chain release factor N(5)-glutamine methyltransferase [Thermoanaerobaculales bacterium]